MNKQELLDLIDETFLTGGSNTRASDVRAALGDTLDSLAFLETKATFADVTLTGDKRIIDVVADESNGGERTLYYFDGTKLNWIVSQIID
jgi:hypothetical protein